MIHKHWFSAIPSSVQASLTHTLWACCCGGECHPLAQEGLEV